MKRALFFIAGVTAAVPIVGNLLWRRASDRIEQALLAGTDKASGAVTPEQFAGVPDRH